MFVFMGCTSLQAFTLPSGFSECRIERGTTRKMVSFGTRFANYICCLAHHSLVSSRILNDDDAAFKTMATRWI
jgi:hypothetical protein